VLTSCGQIGDDRSGRAERAIGCEACAIDVRRSREKDVRIVECNPVNVRQAARDHRLALGRAIAVGIDQTQDIALHRPREIDVAVAHGQHARVLQVPREDLNREARGQTKQRE
jgi:hypothetical protein